MHLAIVGAGWAGLAAAVSAVDAGHRVTVFEAARTPGGRARSFAMPAPHGDERVLDNGQHILIGAYSETLRLMAHVGVDIDAALLRLAFSLTFPDGAGLRLPRLTAPLDAVAGIVRATGWSWRDKASLLRAALRWRRAGFECAARTTVAELCSGVSPRVREEMIDPLCVSALNTPAERASAQVFLRVLRDAMFAGAGASNLLLPRVDLGSLFPAAAARWLSARGYPTRTGRRVRSLNASSDGSWQVDGETFDSVLLACPPIDAARLLADASGITASGEWQKRAQALRFEAIATVYLEGVHRLDAPMHALRSSSACPAQFVFDRSWLGGPDGLWAMVVSASDMAREPLEAAVCEQARRQLGAVGARVLQTVVEKRATFACTPGLMRPGMQIAAGLLACGDYVEGPYPATLEGAVRSGMAAAAMAVARSPALPDRVHTHPAAA
ncbi:MAG: desaturase [Comamonadaceae bacterium]|nr:MAG: desaturase [Comamonadaceae bacterium]